MLLLPFIKGNMIGAFDQLHSIVISQKVAETFFGDSNPIGKSMQMGHDQAYTVTGVFSNLPVNSSFRFQWLIPFEVVWMKYGWL